MATTKNRLRLGYRRIVQLLVFLVIVPTVLLLATGIVLISLGEAVNLIVGLLTVSFVLVIVSGIVLAIVFLRREASLSELQADFVSKVSHELRTPLTSIRLFVETMERARGDPATQEQCLSALSNETDRLTNLIERLLDWGRMEAGRKRFDIAKTEVADIVADAVAAFSGTAHHDGVRFTSEPGENLPAIFVDRHAIVDALLNLLSNAAKYGGSPARIILRAKLEAAFVVFEVSDSGAGIPRPEHRRIFDKFYRIDDRLSRKTEGSGLGLAIVKHIVRAHGGRIAVESEEGMGSTFRILIPCRPPRRLRGAISRETS